MRRHRRYSSFQPSFTNQHNPERLLLTSMAALVVCALLVVGSLFAHQAQTLWASAREVTAVQFEDMRLGQVALLVGPLDAPAAPGQFAVFITEYKSCSEDEDGDTSCSWNESSRWTPEGVRVDGVRIENGDYQLTGRLAEQTTFFGDARTRGIPPGATVLAAIKRTTDGAWARELYIGSITSYRTGWSILVWALGIAAVVSGLVGLGSGVLWWTS